MGSLDKTAGKRTRGLKRRPGAGSDLMPIERPEPQRVPQAPSEGAGVLSMGAAADLLGQSNKRKKPLGQGSY